MVEVAVTVAVPIIAVLEVGLSKLVNHAHVAIFCPAFFFYLYSNSFNNIMLKLRFVMTISHFLAGAG